MLGRDGDGKCVVCFAVPSRFRLTLLSLASLLMLALLFKRLAFFEFFWLDFGRC